MDLQIQILKGIELTLPSAPLGRVLTSEILDPSKTALSFSKQAVMGKELPLEAHGQQYDLYC